MDDDILYIQTTTLLQIKYDLFISVLDMKTAEIGNFFCEPSFHINGAGHGRNTGCIENSEIVFAEGGCLMDNSRATFDGYIVI